MKVELSSKIGKGLNFLALCLSMVSVLGMVAIVAIIVISVFMRKFFNYPLFFSEEIVGILMSVSLFLALPMVTLKGTHIRLTIVSQFLKQRSEVAFTIISRIAYFVGIAFCAWLLIEAVPWLQFAIKHNLKTETARILLYPWMLSLPVSIFLMGSIFIALFFGWVRETNDEKS